jgi:Flp pilus assembly CpaE family ATPase
MRPNDVKPTWRTSRRRQHANSGEPLLAGLSFQRAPGPLLAVAGLSGGAGASVLAYLIAVTAARESSVPVLVADTGGPTGGLAVHAGVSAPRTLADIAQRIAADDPVTGAMWADGEHGLRVLAGSPQFTVDGDRDAILRVLSDARHAHGLTVADAGTLARRAEQAALAAATHVAWTLPANRDGVTRARRVLERIVPLSRPEIVVARATAGKPPMADLADLADDRRAPLVLMPSFGDVSHSSEELAEAAQLALQAIGGVLRR